MLMNPGEIVHAINDLWIEFTHSSVIIAAACFKSNVRYTLHQTMNVVVPPIINKTMSIPARTAEDHSLTHSNREIASATEVLSDAVVVSLG